MFKNRMDAGIMLARKISEKVQEKNVIVLALARGGVVVGRAISDFLEFPLDVLVVKKIGVPTNPELAIGAVAGRGAVYWNDSLCKELGVTPKQKSLLKNQKEIERSEQEKILRGRKRATNFKNKVVILVDDGVATGATVIAASIYLKKENSRKLILAVPVIAKDTIRDIKSYFDMILALKRKKEFMAVGEFYEYFPQVSNDEVIKILN